MGFFKGHTTTIRANKIADFTVATAEYGSPVAEVLGTTRISGNVIYYDDFTAHEHRETQRSGKGGGSKTVSISYSYTVAVNLGLCEGPIKGLGKVWVGKDIYSYPNDKIQLTLFKGTKDQPPWAYTQGKHPDKALAYSGLAYMAGVVDLGDSGSLPNYNFEVAGKLLETGDGVDVNPADYIRYILDKVGLSDVEIIGLDNYRAYCKAADMLISTPPDTTKDQSARDIINEIATLTNAYIFWSNDVFKIVPLEDRNVGDWKPNRTILYDLTADDFIPQSGGALVTYQRKDSSEVYNQFPVEFINRENGYEKESVSYALNQDIADYGLRQANTTTAHYLYKKERAVKLAEQLARQNQYGRNKYTFKLDWSFCRLEVGDLVTLSDSDSGLTKQVALIDSVTEGTDGLLTFTAISRPDGDYTEAKYDVHENDRPYIDYNTTAPDTDRPVILQPPADLTATGLELWIGTRGTADNWGGCEVYVSDDNTNYRHAGTISSTARIGTLAKAVTAMDTTIEVAANGAFLSGTEQDAERGNTLCWLDGECFSYQTANLLPGGHYQLTGCIRGQYNTTAQTHSTGTTFARLDAALLKAPFRKEDVGKKIWLKFVSYNVFGSGFQDLADVDAYEYTIMPYYIPPVTNVRAYNRYRQMVDGVSRYDIVVEWTPPDLQSYLEGQVWYKTNHQQAANLVIKEGRKADEMGFDGEWTFGGSGKNQVVIPQAVVGDTYRIAVCTKDEWGVATSPDAAPMTEIVVAMKSMIPNVPDGFSIAFREAAVVSWNEVTNTDIAYYEVRKDTQPGAETEGLLARTNGLQATLALTARQGTLYLYARNAQGKYSNAAVLQYSKEIPPTPQAPTLTTKLGGFSIVADAIPDGCTGMNIYIDASGKDEEDKVISTPNNVYSYMCGAGIYDVSVAYRDLFGEGGHSPSASVTVKVLIDDDFIKDEGISLKKVDQTIKDAINNAQGNQEEIQKLQENIQSNLERINELKSSVTGLQQTDTELSNTIKQQKQDQDGINQDYASQIKQNANGISTIVANLSDTSKANAAYKAFSSVQQTTDSIKTMVSENKTTQDNINENFTSQIQQTATGINTIVANLNSLDSANNAYKAFSSIKQTTDSITSTVTANKTAQDNANQSFTSQIRQNANSITSVVTNLNDKDEAAKNYAAFTQLVDTINLRVQKDNVINQINVSPESILIDGSKIHITGKTVFDDDVQVKAMIEAKSITADKLSVDSLSAITATIGTLRTKESGARTEIHDNLIEVYDENDTLRVRMGVW